MIVLKITAVPLHSRLPRENFPPWRDEIAIKNFELYNLNLKET